MPGRKLDDNVQILMRYASGARGMLWASQVASGNENALQHPRLRLQGRHVLGAGAPQACSGSRLRQAQPDHHPRLGRANARGRPDTRVPTGHPEGYLEGFATIYSEVAERSGPHAPVENPTPR